MCRVRREMSGSTLGETSLADAGLRNCESFCLFFVVGSHCKNLVRPGELACWVVHVRGHLVLVIVQISVEHQHPEAWSIQQFFCVITTCANKRNKQK